MEKSIKEILIRESESLEIEYNRIELSKMQRLDQTENDTALRRIQHRIEMIRQTIILLDVSTEIDE